MLKIYLACPYSHPKEATRKYRFAVVSSIAAQLMQRGNLVYSPISHTHPIAKHGNLPLGWEFWQTLDEHFISWADELWVLCLDDWTKSEGVACEIAIAQSLNKVVRFITDSNPLTVEPPYVAATSELD